MGKARATAIGFTAVLMWSLLALLTIGSAPVPPLLLNALTFGLGGGLGLIWIVRAGGLARLRQVPLAAYALGTAGLFLYHLIYFTAFRLRPGPETGLIAYLWPLLIVLFSGLLPGERLRPLHVLGAAIAFLGAALIVWQGAAVGSGSPPLAMALAFAAALIWAGYSVLSRRFSDVPTEAVAVYCLATAALSLMAHLALEPTVWPLTPTSWLAILTLGLGPVGAAFFTWDIGMKRGNIQLLGTASYAAPLLSTLALLAAGHGQATPGLLISAMMIAGGAGLAALAGRGVSARSGG